MEKRLTKKQEKLLDFCTKNAKVIPPTYDEMAKFMNVKSKQSCFDMIKLIEKKIGRKLGDIVLSRSTKRNLGGVGSYPTISTNGTNYQDFNYKIFYSPPIGIKMDKTMQNNEQFIEETIKEFEKLPHYRIFLKDQSEFLRQALTTAEQRGRADMAEKISEAVEGMKKKVCSLCGNSIESSPHWEENGIYFCPCSNHTCRGKNSTAPCINIAGDEKDIGYNLALSNTLLAIKQVINK